MRAPPSMPDSDERLHAPFPFLLPRGIVGPLHVLRPKDAAYYKFPSS
jgi:hypothetical protein